MLKKIQTSSSLATGSYILIDMIFFKKISRHLIKKTYTKFYSIKRYLVTHGPILLILLTNTWDTWTYFTCGWLTTYGPILLKDVNAHCQFFTRLIKNIGASRIESISIFQAIAIFGSDSSSSVNNFLLFPFLLFTYLVQWNR